MNKYILPTVLYATTGNSCERYKCCFRVDLLVHIQLQLCNAYHPIRMALWVHPMNFDVRVGSLWQCSHEPGQVVVVATSRSGIATLPIPQGVAHVPLVGWGGMRCWFTVVIVADKRWRLITPYITRTVGSTTLLAP